MAAATRSSSDPGEFASLTSDERRALEGLAFKLRAELVNEPREPEQWTVGFLMHIHRELFEEKFPGQAGALRYLEVTLGNLPVPPPVYIAYRLDTLAARCRDIVRQSREIHDPRERVTVLVPMIADVHAQSVVVQPFIDGNKRWACMVTDALMSDCGFRLGAKIDRSDKPRYMEAISKAVNGRPEQLASMILKGWMALRMLAEKRRQGRDVPRARPGSFPNRGRRPRR